MKIGKAIKQIRKEKNITLRELSAKSGVALATLSRIENDKMTGTVSSHNNIALALDATLADLYSGFEPNSDKTEHVITQEQPDVFVHNNKATYDILTKRMLSKKMMPILLKLEHGAKTAVEQSQKGSEKFLYVIDGEMEAIVNKKAFTLCKGNSFYFDASLPHFWRNNSNKLARVLCVTTPPAL